MNLKSQIEAYIPYNEQEEKDKKLMLQYFELFDDVLTRNNSMCHFCASAWIVNKDRTKVLMVYHNMYHSLTWVGGHADGDENLLRVAIREVHEETGLKHLKVLSEDIFGLEVLGCQGHIKRSKYVSSHLHLDCCFLFEASEKDILIVKEDENSEVRWVPIDQVISLCEEEHMIPIYQKIMQKVENYAKEKATI